MHKEFRLKFKTPDDPTGYVHKMRIPSSARLLGPLQLDRPMAAQQGLHAMACAELS